MFTKQDVLDLVLPVKEYKTILSAVMDAGGKDSLFSWNADAFGSEILNLSTSR